MIKFNFGISAEFETPPTMLKSFVTLNKLFCFSKLFVCKTRQLIIPNSQGVVRIKWNDPYNTPEFLAFSMHSKVLASIMGKIHTYQLFNTYSYLFYKYKEGRSVTCLPDKCW